MTILPTTVGGSLPLWVQVSSYHYLQAQRLRYLLCPPSRHKGVDVEKPDIPFSPIQSIKKLIFFESE